MSKTRQNGQMALPNSKACVMVEDTEAAEHWVMKADARQARAERVRGLYECNQLSPKYKHKAKKIQRNSTQRPKSNPRIFPG